jgi:hypothetical protein
VADRRRGVEDVLAKLNVLAMIIFDSEENARAAGDRVSANFSQLENRDDVTLDGVEVREVVASAG